MSRLYKSNQQKKGCLVKDSLCKTGEGKDINTYRPYPAEMQAS